MTTSPWRESLPIPVALARSAGLVRDQVHILGGPLSGEMIPGSTGAVRRLYRVSPDVGDAGARALEDSLRDAYRKTQSELSTNAELQSLFYPQFIERFHRSRSDRRRGPSPGPE